MRNRKKRRRERKLAQQSARKRKRQANNATLMMSWILSRWAIAWCYRMEARQFMSIRPIRTVPDERHLRAMPGYRRVGLKIRELSEGMVK